MLWLWRDVRSPLGAAAAVAVSLATPGMQLFFGYVENYSLVAVAAVLFAIAADRAVAGRCSPLVPAVALGAAVPAVASQYDGCALSNS